MMESRRACRGLQFSTIPWARNPLVSNSFPLTFLADPHLLNPTVSISYKNGGGKGSRQSSTHVPTPLKSTPAGQSTSVANKGLTPKLSLLDATLTKNIGVGVALILDPWVVTRRAPS